MPTNRVEVAKELQKEKVIVIVRGYTGETLISLAEAMWEGGIRFLEVTFDHSGKISAKETAQDIHALVTRFAGRMHIGAGTVLSPDEVDLVEAAGGEYIISPNVSVDVIRRTRECGMLSMPGALTPSEIVTAYENGADFVKLFPVSSFGTDYVKAVHAPLSHIPLLAVGGVNEGNLSDYLRAGACGFGIGSNIINKKMIAEGDFCGITKLAQAFIASLHNAVAEVEK